MDYRGLWIEDTGGDDQDHRYCASIETDEEPERYLYGDTIAEMKQKIDRYLDAAAERATDLVDG